MSLLVNTYSTLVNPPEIDFPCQLIKHRTLDDKLMPAHLAALQEYIVKAGKGNMTINRQALSLYIGRIKHHFVFMIKQSQLDDLVNWGWRASAITYMPDGSIRNPSGRVLQTADGKMEQDAKIPYPADALQRKEKTDNYLKSIGLKTSPQLPPVVGEEEVVLRSAEDVAKRALALMIVAVQAEAFRHDKPNNPDDFITRCPIGHASLTQQERDFMYGDGSDQQVLVNMFWRYESVMLLQWMLGWQKDLLLSGKISDPAHLVTTGIDFCKSIKGVSLRPTENILDTLDLYYRLHWLSTTPTDHPMLTNEVTKNIIKQRHYSLNWLTKSDPTAWD